MKGKIEEVAEQEHYGEERSKTVFSFAGEKFLFLKHLQVISLSILLSSLSLQNEHHGPPLKSILCTETSSSQESDFIFHAFYPYWPAG